jgi:RimJ/RimL family protein N-acetyltransferase
MSVPAASLNDRTAPTLETERLRLRAHRVTDHASLAAISADPITMRHLGGQLFSLEESWLRLLRYPGLWQLLGYGYWAIEEKATERYIGHIGYADYKRDITPTIDGMPEVGWVLASDVHGRGYATEALRTVLAWGDVHFGEHVASCIISPDNTASIRLARKVGFRFSQEAIFHESVIHIFVR